MKIAVVGSRTFNDYNTMVDAVSGFAENLDEIISGGANGADALAKKLAEDLEVGYTEFPADWNKNGKVAGFIRNQQIVDASDFIIAFWDGESNGTKDTIDKARKAKKATLIIYF